LVAVAAEVVQALRYGTCQDLLRNRYLDLADQAELELMALVLVEMVAAHL
jgi:hypothetical protein